MRLIDADALSEEITRDMKKGFPKNDNLPLFALSCIAHAPTVCDIEQIRDEIEKLEPFDSLYDYSDAIKDVLEVIDRYTKGE